MIATPTACACFGVRFSYSVPKIVIGSIYARAGEYMKAGMEAVIEKEALPGNVKTCRILPAGLGETIGDIAALSVAMHTK